MALPYPRTDYEMTVAIAAIVPSIDCIVTVSDARISHGEMVPAADDGTLKNRKVASTWGMMFAATDASAFVPVLNSVYEATGYTGKEVKDAPFSSSKMKSAVQAAYEKEFNERFFREHLARFGYASIAEFRQSGFNEMGKDLYHQYSMALAKHDLGLELLVYGFDERARYIFEVANPGKIISHNLRGFTAIGSGSLMALAALNRKPLSQGLSQTIYRLLDAKFSSETAPAVGRKTHVFIMNSKGKYAAISQPNIQKIRGIWDEEMKRPDPENIMDLLANTSAVKTMSEEES